MNPKVSLVVPCYNGGKFIDNFMNSVMLLNYDNIQLIITNDGSTDDSYEKLLKYKEKIESLHIEYIVLNKENGGQPSAFNCGIQKATGKYVAWPDIDDRMHPDFIIKKVEYMEKNPDTDFLLSKSAIVPLENKEKILGYTWPNMITDNSALVDRVLRDYECWFEPGAFFAKLESMEKFIPNRHIYDGCGTWSGPQIQITLPFFYKGKIGYLDDCLYDYYIHASQHHSMVKDKEKLERKNQEVKKMLDITVKNLNVNDESQLLRKVEERMIRTATVQAFSEYNKKVFLINYKKFDKEMITFKDKIRYCIVQNRLFYLGYKVFRSVKHSAL